MASKKEKIIDIAIENPSASVKYVADMAGASYHYTYKVMNGKDYNKKSSLDIPTPPEDKSENKEPTGFLFSIKSFFNMIYPRY